MLAIIFLPPLVPEQKRWEQVAHVSKGRMPFLSSNQHGQNTEGKSKQ